LVIAVLRMPARIVPGSKNGSAIRAVARRPSGPTIHPSSKAA
jgi:hypothetical protein